MKNMKNKSKIKTKISKLRKSFTLIELLVTIGIIAILVVIGVVSYGSINRRSRDTRRKSDIEQLRSALEMYRSDKGYYPDIYNGGAAIFSNVENLRTELVTNNSYLPDIPEDPKDNTTTPYQIIFQKDASQAHYYRYCITAALEGTGESQCTGISSYPSAAYIYGVKNP